MNPAPLPTLSESQTGCKTLINAGLTAPSEPITFPARPVQGGRLELAPRKIGLWFAEPKYNGWRALLHVPSGAMWNRRGERLRIADHFTQAIAQLRLMLPGTEWLDCEALERRHTLGRGTLIVLDLARIVHKPKGESCTGGGFGHRGRSLSRDVAATVWLDLGARGMGG